MDPLSGPSHETTEEQSPPVILPSTLPPPSMPPPAMPPPAIPSSVPDREASATSYPISSAPAVTTTNGPAVPPLTTTTAAIHTSSANGGAPVSFGAVAAQDHRPPKPTHSQSVTPEPRPDPMPTATQTNSPSTPGVLPPYDWEDFETRYRQALHEADQDEHEILAEFDHLVKYFNVWASTSSAHDNERAVRRLKTRQRYVSLSEESMQQKQKHYQEVLVAFQSALALLGSR